MLAPPEELPQSVEVRVAEEHPVLLSKAEAEGRVLAVREAV
jgi:hypothetical protein